MSVHLQLQELSSESYQGFSASTMTQFSVLFERTLKCNTRNTKLMLSVYIGAGLLVGLTFWGIGNDAEYVDNNFNFLLVLNVSMFFLLYTALVPPVLTFPMEMALVQRELLNNWYSLKAYYLAKTMADLPFQVIFPAVYCSMVYWMTAQPLDAARFFYFLSRGVIVTMFGHSLGLLIGAARFDPQVLIQRDGQRTARGCGNFILGIFIVSQYILTNFVRRYKINTQR